MAFFHMKFQSILSLVLFTLTDDPQFYGLEISLSNILMIGLFLSSNRMIVFSNTEKNSYHSKHVRDHTFITSTWGSIKVCHMFADSFFLNQKIYCSFSQVEGLGSQNWSLFVIFINVWSLNDLKLQPVQSLEAVVSSLTSGHKPDTFWLRREQLPPAHTPTHSPLDWGSTRIYWRTVTLQFV